MNKRANNELLWSEAVQLIFAALLVVILYSFGSSVINNNNFREQAYAADIGLTGSVMASSDEGSMKITMLLGLTDKKVVLTPKQISIIADESLASTKLLTKKGVNVIPAEIRSQALVWERNGDSITISSYTPINPCSLTPSKQAWNYVYVYGDEKVAFQVREAIERIPGVLTQPNSMNSDSTIKAESGFYGLTAPDNALGDQLVCLAKEIAKRESINLVTKQHASNEIILSLIPEREEQNKRFVEELFREVID